MALLGLALGFGVAREGEDSAEEVAATLEALWEVLGVDFRRD